MVAEFLRDFAQPREARGLNFATAGSINNGDVSGFPRTADVV